MKHGRMELCFALAAAIRSESPFVCSARVNGSCGTETAEQIQTTSRVCFCVHVKSTSFLSVSRSDVSNVRGACLQSARGGEQA